MKLKIIGSGSTGNAYILESSSGDALLIECGLNIAKIKQALNFDLRKVVGCIVTHEHGDHAIAMESIMDAGINVYATEGTFKAKGLGSNHRAIGTFSGDEFKVGSFRVKAFEVKHDVNEPVGFLIMHEECGKVLFLTDSYYCPWKFSGLNNIIIEANYCKTILDKRMNAGENPAFLRDRVITSHMSLQTCKGMLEAHDLNQVNNIVLIHLSDRNSDAKRFKMEVEQQTGKRVHIATEGLIINNFNKKPF